MESHQGEWRKEKRIIKTEIRLRELCDIIKHNIHIIGVWGEEEKGVENLSKEIRAENFPNVQKETNIQILEAQKVLNKINTRRRHIID